MADVYTGQVQGLSKIATGTPSAFCRAVTGGSLQFDLHNISKVGIGGIKHSRKGTTEATLEFTCVGPAKADIQLWFPTVLGVVVASFPDFLVEADDGSGGQEFVLSGCQPASCTISCAEGEDAEVEYSFTLKAALVTPASAGTDVPVYNGVKGHTRNDVVVQIGAADQNVLSFSMGNDLGVKMHNPMNSKASGALTWPAGYIVTKSEPSFSCVTSKAYNSSALFGDTHTPVTVTLSFSNGTAGEDIDFTISNLIPNTWNMPLEAEDMIGFAHEFGLGDGTIYNRVVAA